MSRTVEGLRASLEVAPPRVGGGRRASRPPDTHRLASPDARLRGQPEPAEASSGPVGIGVVRSAVDRLDLAAEDLRCAGAALPGGPGGRRDNRGWDGSGLPARGGRVGAGRRRPGVAGARAGRHRVPLARLLQGEPGWAGYRKQLVWRTAGAAVGADSAQGAGTADSQGCADRRPVAGAPPADPGANLAVLASRARHALGDSSLIVVSEGGYVFADDDRCWVDAEAFAADAERGRMALASGHAAAALRSYRSALALWAGDPLVENQYEEWAQGHRRLFARLYEEALEGAARAALQVGQAAVALHFAGILSRARSAA